MAVAADAAERYRADFGTAGESVPAWLAGLRKRAMERFAETGFPTARRGNEAWKYTNVSPIANAELGLAPATDITLSKALRGAPPLRAAPDGAWTTLVFVNGRFAGGSGNEVAIPLAAALDQDDSWVEAHLARTGSIDSGGFAALNAAFLTDAAVVRVPAGGPLAAVHLVFIATGESSISHPARSSSSSGTPAPPSSRPICTLRRTVWSPTRLPRSRPATTPTSSTPSSCSARAARRTWARRRPASDAARASPRRSTPAGPSSSATRSTCGSQATAPRAGSTGSR